MLAAAFGAGVQLAVFGRIGQSGGVFYTSPCLVYMGIYVLTAFCLPRAAAAAVSGRVRRGQADPGALLAGSLALAAVAGGAGAALLGFGGEMLAAWSGRPMERYAWEALAPAVWLMALLGALRGTFPGAWGRRSGGGLHDFGAGGGRRGCPVVCRRWPAGGEAARRWCTGRRSWKAPWEPPAPWPVRLWGLGPACCFSWG